MMDLPAEVLEEFSLVPIESFSKQELDTTDSLNRFLSGKAPGFNFVLEIIINSALQALLRNRKL